MNLLILITALLTFIVIFQRFGVITFLGGGFFGLFSYSIPAFINKSRHFFYLDNTGFYLYQPSFEAMAVYLITWLVFLLFVLLIPTNFVYRNYSVSQSFNFPIKNFMYSGLYLSTLVIMYRLFPIFTVSFSSVGLSTIILIIGRWIIALTFIAALLNRSFYASIYLLILLIYWFLSGDRTLIGITIYSALIIYLQNYFKSNFIRISNLFNIKIFLLLSSLILLVVFGKPIYLSITNLNIEHLSSKFASKDELVYVLSKSFEPMIIFNHVQYVIENSIEVNFFDFIGSLLAHFLIFPSYFGVNTNLYNEVLTSSFPITMSYGIAGNYLAHAYSIMGYFGVIFFAFMYVFFVYICDKFFMQNKGVSRILFALLGGLISVYAHRNGLDNLLSFVRQILIAFCVISLVSIFFRILPRKKNYFE